MNSLLGALGCWIWIISSLGHVIHGKVAGLPVYEFPQLDIIHIRPHLT